MKLPGISRDQPGHVALRDVNLPLVEANARASAFRAVGGIAVAVDEAFKRYDEREAVRQTQAGVLGVQQRLIEAEQSYGSKKEFNLLDADATNDSNLSEAIDKAGIENLGQTIPAYRVKPELMGTAWDNAIDEYAQGISNPEAKAKFIFEQKKARNGGYLKDTVQASKDQVVYQAEQTKQAVTSAVQNKDYGGARLAIIESELTQQEQAKELKGVTRVEQIDTFSGILKERNPDAMQLALDDILDEKSATSSELTEPEEKVYANQLRTAISQEQAKTEGTRKGLTALVTDNARNMITEFNAGGVVDTKEVIETLSMMDQSDPVVARDLRSAIRNSGRISILNQMSAQYMQKAKTAPQAVHATAQDAEDAALLDKRIDANLQAIKADTMGFMIDNHVSEVVPLDFGSLESLSETLSTRVGNYALAQEMYGYSSGYLSHQEVMMAGDMLDRTTDPSKRMELFGAINQALKTSAPKFYEQLKNNGVGGADMLAGQLASDGDVQSAVTIVQGSQLLKGPNGKDLINTDTKTFINDAVVSKFGNAFAGNSVQRALMKDAVTAVYARLSDAQNDFGSTDSNRLNQAMKIATGGLISYNGSTIQSPAMNFEESDFEDWVDKIDPNTFASMNVLQTPDEVKDKITSGDWKIRGVGRGVYNIVDGRGATVGNLENNAVPFQLNYDPTAVPTYNKPTQDQLDRIKAGNVTEKRMFSGVGIPSGIKKLLGLGE